MVHLHAWPGLTKIWKAIRKRVVFSHARNFQFVEVRAIEVPSKIIHHVQVNRGNNK